VELQLYTDGGARGNPGPGAIGVLLCDSKGDELIRHSDCIGEATNNIAEYCALIAGLEIARQYDPQVLDCFLDSELVVKQVTGLYKVKNERIKRLFDEVKKLESIFNRITFTHVPRTHPQMRIADKLVNLALDEEAKSQ
jgi:ribonuclease HI